MTGVTLLRERAKALWPLAAVSGGAVIGLLATRISTPLVALVALLGLLAAAVVVAAPEIGLLAIVFASYLNLSDVLQQRFGGPVSLLQLLIPLVGLAVLAQWFWRRSLPTGWPRSALLVTVYGLAGVLSLLTARDPGRTIEGLIELAKDGLLVVLVVILIQRAATLRRVLWALLAAGLLMATISVHQHVTENFGSDYWGLATGPVTYAGGTQLAYRVTGPVGDPNYYAMILLALIPIALDRVTGSRRPMARVLALATLGACSLTIVFTYSRGALVALLAMLALLVLVRRPRLRHVLAAIVVAVLLLPLVPATYVQRMGTIFQKMGAVVVTITQPAEATWIEDQSFRGRLSENLVAARMFLDHPLVGVGFDNYSGRYQDYSQRLLLDPRSENRAPHNLYLEIAAETGIVGLFAFGTVLWVLFRGILLARRSLQDQALGEIRGMMDAVTIALTAWLIASLFLHAAHTRYFWLLAGIALALPRAAENETAAVERGGGGASLPYGNS